jgi:3-oxoacyl-[acyl-carrier-protein] synthase III
LPTAASIGIEQGRVQPGENVTLMGIGSGINVIILGLTWGDRGAASNMAQ